MEKFVCGVIYAVGAAAYIILIAIAVFLVFTFVVSARDDLASSLYVGDTYESTIILCNEEHHIESLIFAETQGNLLATLVELKEQRACGVYFTEYKIIGAISKYYDKSIMLILHDRGIFYSWADFSTIKNELQAP